MRFAGGLRVKIMVADDDDDLVNMLNYLLKKHGYEVICAFDGEQVITRWRETMPDLILLNVHMPKLDGFEVCSQMQHETPAWVVMLSASDREDEEVRGLEMGADAYVRKPCSPRQLLARIQALLRRSRGTSEACSASVLTVGPITLDTMRYEVSQDDRKVQLTPLESHLLQLLMRHPGQVLTSALIAERIWGHEEIKDSGILKTHIRHLRQKVERDASHPHYILTVPGLGYQFTVSVLPA